MQIIERQVVSDPLAANPNSNASAPQLGQMAVRNPNQTGGTDWIENQNAIQKAVGSIAAGLAQKADQAKDDAITEGKLQYMQGATQADIVATGDKYTMQGWQAMESATSANDFVLAEELRVDEEDYQLTPDEYRKQMLQRRADKLKTLPADPVSRKMWASSFDDTSARLIAKQTIKHNEYNKQRTEESFSNQLESTSRADPNTSRVMPGSDLRVSPGVVSAPIKVSAYDRDVGIRTMLGEAGNEGSQGMAAVAHVMKNRTGREGFGGKSIAEVALADKQFSTWNADIDTARKFSPTSARYKQAGQIFDLVMAGRVADMTGGADHYYSPAGMQAYKKMGIATSGDVPTWAQGKAVSAKMGGHLFYNLAGKAAAVRDDRPAIAQGEVQTGVFSNPADVANEVNFGRDDRDQTQAVELMPSAQDILLNSPILPPRRKAELAAQRMIDTLKQGDDTLYNELGGDASLRKLGLPESEIDKVHQAYNSYKIGKANDFNVAFEKQKDEMLQAVKRGDIAPEDAGQWLEEQTAIGTLTQDGARSLQQQYFNAAREGDDKFIETPELQIDLANLQMALSAERDDPTAITLEQSLAHAKVLAQKYNIPEKKMESVTQGLVNLEKQRIENIRAEIKKNGEERQKNIKKANSANAAIATGYGLNDLSGTMTITLNDGTEKEISVKQFGVNQIKQGIILEAQRKVGRGGSPGTMTMEQASVWADREIHVQLNKQHVVDEDQRRMVTSALNGGVIGPDGKITEDAQQALDWYVTIAEDPRLGPVYASQYTDSEQAKALALTTREMMAGGLQLQDAIYKAHAQLSAKIENDTTGNKDFVARKVIDDKIGEAMDMITEDDTGSLRGWSNWLFGTRTLTPEQYKTLESQKSVVSNRIAMKAKQKKLTNPQISETVAIEGAINDTAKEGVHLGDEIIFETQPSTRKDVSVLMGFNGDKLAPNDALQYYVEKHYDKLFTGDVGKAILANSQRKWYEEFNSKVGAVVDLAQASVQSTLGSIPSATSPRLLGAAYENVQEAKKGFAAPKLPYYTKVDMRTGLIQLSFYKPDTGETLLTKVIKLDAMGQEYKKDKLNNPTVFGEVTKRIRNTLSPISAADGPEAVPELGTPVQQY